MNIPDGHQTVMPYLILKTAEAFIDFTGKVFNAELKQKIFREGEPIIMHAEVIVNGSTIMFCDATDQWPAATSSLFAYVDDADESFAKAKEAGASVLMELSNQSYGRTCGIRDTTGNIWWITSVK